MLWKLLWSRAHGREDNDNQSGVFLEVVAHHDQGLNGGSCVVDTFSPLILSYSWSNTMYLLTEREGRTGKYLGRGHGVRTERSEVRAP